LRIRIGNGLLPLNLLVIVLGAIIIFPLSDVVRIILGTPFVFFFPGYALVAALFPKKEGVGGIERVALSFGLSIAVVPLIGLILNATPWGIGLESSLYSVASFIFITSVIAWFRWRRLPASERFNIEFQMTMLGWGKSAWDKALSVVLVLTILGALATVGYIIAIPKVGESFSELYILGLEGKAADYPSELIVGEEGRVIVGITNNEHKTVSYRVEVRIDGEKNNEIGPIMLEHGERWEGEASFVPQVPGENQKVEFLLYKNGEDEPYMEPLRLWVDVIWETSFGIIFKWIIHEFSLTCPLLSTDIRPASLRGSIEPDRMLYSQDSECYNKGEARCL